MEKVKFRANTSGIVTFFPVFFLFILILFRFTFSQDNFYSFSNDFYYRLDLMRVDWRASALTPTQAAIIPTIQTKSHLLFVIQRKWDATRNGTKLKSEAYLKSVCSDILCRREEGEIE